MTVEVAPIVVPDELAAYQAGDAQSLIDQATAVVRRYCRWHVTPSVTETVTLDGSGVKVQPLPSLHVTAVTSVTEDGVLLDSTAYTWSQNGLLRRVRPWSDRDRGVVVVMTHGHNEAPDLAGVILALASRSQGNPNAMTRMQMGPFSEQYEISSGFTDAELVTLDHYRLPPCP